MNVLG